MIALWGHVVGSAIVRLLPRRVVVPRRRSAAAAGARSAGRARSSGRRGTCGASLGTGVPEREVRRADAAGVSQLRAVHDRPALAGADRHARSARRPSPIVGWEHVVEALGRGKGMVLVTGHLGNWDLPAAVLAGRGLPGERDRGDAGAAGLERARAGDPRADRAAGDPDGDGRPRDVRGARAERDRRHRLRPAAGARAACRSTYFGAETTVPEGVARLALRTGAAVVGAVGRPARRPDRRPGEPAVRGRGDGRPPARRAGADADDRVLAGRARAPVPEPVVHVPRLLARPGSVRAMAIGARSRTRLTVAAYRLAVPLAGAVPPDVAYPILDRLADLVRLGCDRCTRRPSTANLEQVLGRRGTAARLGRARRLSPRPAELLRHVPAAGDDRRRDPRRRSSSTAASISERRWPMGAARSCSRRTSAASRWQPRRWRWPSAAGPWWSSRSSRPSCWT